MENPGSRGDYNFVVQNNRPIFICCGATETEPERGYRFVSYLKSPSSRECACRPTDRRREHQIAPRHAESVVRMRLFSTAYEASGY
jgi:hypothetical protein